MKPFNLEEYLTNPSRKLVTRDGREARIICTDRLTANYPICALVNNGREEEFNSYTIDGKYCQNKASYLDLFFAPKKKEGWINIYKNNWSGEVYHSKEDAFNGRIKHNYITTIKIEWEE